MQPVNTRPAPASKQCLATQADTSSKSSTVKTITILGATGSIGASTLKVVSAHRQCYRVFALTAHRQIEKLAQLCTAYSPKYAVVADEHYADAKRLFDSWPFDDKSPATTLLPASVGLELVASHAEVDVVMAAIVGCAGLAPTLAALSAGKRVLLANKEALIMAGELMLSAIKNGGLLLPVDSEHNAIFQSLPAHYLQHIHTKQAQPSDFGVSHVSLTASGGPFLHTPIGELKHVTADEACAHPNWSMGQKISVDSATMMNKGLELIEACLLFGLTEAQVKVVVHPQSVLHSAVHYTDGSVVAQLGEPDMCIPIAHVMSWPERQGAPVKPLDFTALSELTFYTPDDEKFPCLMLAREAIRHSQAAVATLNVANESAVHAFLQGRLSFLQIAELNAAIMDTFTAQTINCVDDILLLQKKVERQAEALIKEF